MQKMTGLFRDEEAAKMAVLALQESGFSGARMMRPIRLASIKKREFEWNRMQLATELDIDTTELVPVQIKVVYPFFGTAGRVLERMDALWLAKLLPEAK